jgi:hypothetical protein
MDTVHILASDEHGQPITCFATPPERASLDEKTAADGNKFRGDLGSEKGIICHVLHKAHFDVSVSSVASKLANTPVVERESSGLNSAVRCQRTANDCPENF